MADYSRDPIARLEDSITKHYVGVRMQQGVPVLDADLNLKDDLRRSELEDVGTWMLGNGTPVGSNAFNIVPIAGGGIGTLVLTSNFPAVAGVSSLSVDLGISSAATAFGFAEQNGSASRSDTLPARITGNLAEPFALADGSTLVIQINDQAPETITFNAADFTDITAAMVAEVIAVIAAATVAVTATAGNGNDFVIKGGGGTSANAGRLLIDGQMTLIERDINYSEQALFANVPLATAWGVDVLEEIATPAANEAFVVYLDVWNREVASQEDETLVDARIGMETTIRLRREWAVRVVLEVDYLGVVAARSEGHAFYRLALIQRNAGDAEITSDMIVDARTTELSLRREVAYLGTGDAVLVDTDDFTTLLTATRENVRDFIVFLTTQFVNPDDAYLAAEVMGIDTLSVIAGVADHGLALLATKSMGTKDALSFFHQLREAEERFVSAWTDSVLPLNKAGGQVYDTAFALMLERINSYLAGPPPGGFATLPDALASGNLHEAVRAQERINAEIGRELSRSVGFLTLTYLGSATPTIISNQSFDLRYEISGSVTPDDDIDAEVFIDPQWATTLRNADGSIPFALRLGPGEDDAEFVVSVQAPDVSAATTAVSLLVNARGNAGGLRHISTQKTLTIGDPPPPSEEAFVITIFQTNMAEVGGVFQYPSSIPGGLANMTFRLANNANSTLVVDVTFNPDPAPPGWTIIAPSSASLTGVTIPPFDNEEIGFSFLRPESDGATLTFTLTATDQGTSNVVGTTQISMITVAA